MSGSTVIGKTQRLGSSSLTLLFTCILVWVLMIFNKGAYLTFNSIFHSAPNISKLDCEIRSCFQPKLSNVGKVFCWR